MTRYTSSRPCEWVQPRAQSGHSREYIHGALQGLSDDFYSDGFIDRAQPILARAFRIVAWAGFGLAGMVFAYHAIWAGWRVF